MVPDELRLKQIPGIDFDAALTNCGSLDALWDTLKTYHTTLRSNAEKIETLQREGDLRNYTIAVHALKSSSRLIGALALSADALAMENAGNAGDASLIAEKTPALLQAYRTLGEALSGLFPEQNTNDLPEIDTAALKSLNAKLRAAVDDFDLDALDEAVDALSGYRFPDALQDTVRLVRESAAAADWGALDEALGKLET